MATLQDVEAAFLRADQAGDTEAATVLAQEVRRLRSATANAPKASIPERIGMGMADPIHGGAQLLTKMLPKAVVDAGNSANNWLAEKTGLVAPVPAGGVDEMVQRREAQYNASRAGESGFDGWRLLGNIASPANMAVARMFPGAASTVGKVATSAAGGGLSAAAQPVIGGQDFAAEKLKQVGIGALAGGAVPAVVGGVSRVISPRASVNPDLKLLTDAGIKPTIGQALGGRINALEEKATSLPILGDAISNARGNALEQFNRVAINRAAGKVGGSVDEVGQAGVAKAGDMISDAYDKAIGKIKFVRFDQQFASDLGQLKGMAQALTPPMRAKFNKTLDDVVGGRVSAAGSMLGETVKKVDSELGNMAGRYGKSSVASEQELADALKQLQALLRQQVARSSPEASDAMKAADAAWANLVRVEGAAKAGKNSGGLFTPAQLNMAVQQADKSVRKRSVARGTALMQDLASAGQNVLGNKVPNSFTTDRALIAGGGLGSYFIDPLIPAGLLASAGAYSSPMQMLLRNAVATRPDSAQQIAALLNKAAPMLGPAGGLLALEVGK
jgi:hypothetical protein